MDFNTKAMNQAFARQLKRRKQRRVYSWTFLMSLMEGGMLHIKVNAKRVLVRLNKGDGILFRHDVYHGGCAYKLDHFRVHEYWVPKDQDDPDQFIRQTQSGPVVLHGVETDTWDPKDAETLGNSKCVYTGPRYASVADLVRALG
jgi:hypothetical protein